MTLTPFLATDSPVFLKVVTLQPVSGITLTDSGRREGRERGGGRMEGREREGGWVIEGRQRLKTLPSYFDDSRNLYYETNTASLDQVQREPATEC